MMKIKRKKKMSEIVVVFYSNYYQKSVEIKDFFVNENGSNVRTLNVDNKNVREEILNDNTYGIKYVPTLLLLKEDGSMQIYEKEAAISYYEEMKQQKEWDAERMRNKNEFMLKNQGSLSVSQQTTRPLQEQQQDDDDDERYQTKNMSVMDIAKAMENNRS